jgi:aspartyl protease family protein
MDNNQQDQEKNPPSHIGAGMLFGMWILLFILLAYLFSNILDNQHNPNENINSTTMTNGAVETVLERNRYGHYVVSGMINNQDVVFMLDTGASDISIPEIQATKLGLSKGHKQIYQTANGNIDVYLTRLDMVSIGEIQLHNIKATINPHSQSDEILLGMSFLKHLEFTQRGNQLIIRQHPN